MNSLLAVLIIFFVFFLGDVVATKTKAVVSMLFFGAVVFIVAFWCGLPGTIFKDSGLLAFSSITIGMLLAHIGTTINVRDFISEWKTVVIVLISTCAIALGVYFIGQHFMDRYYALSGAPVLAGGMVAFLVMKEVAATLSRPDVTVFAMLVLIFQMFVGMPIASTLLKKEARNVQKSYRDGTLRLEMPEQEKKVQKHTLIPPLPAKYNTASFTLCKLALIAYLAYLLGKWTGITQLIYALLLGVLAREIGFLEENALVKCNGFSFVLASTIVAVWSSLPSATPKMLLSMLPPLILVMVIGVVSGGVVAVLVGRLIHFSWEMSICMAVTALFGFPGTYQIPVEVAKAVGETPEETEAIQNEIMPKMIIAGVVSVSIVSGLLAGLMAKWI